VIDNQHTRFFATCPKNIESLLEEELQRLGAQNTRQTVAGVHFEGTLSVAYRACLWSRLANRILLPLGTFPADNAEILYKQTYAIDWEKHLSPAGSFIVDFTGSSEEIHHTHFGALKVKDAIVDYFRDKFASRPSIEKDTPDLRINVRLHHQEVTISIDLSGESLHKRGYRIETGPAPLKENLAAALLYRIEWEKLAKEQRPLLDPLCGVGTILIEAALMAADIAPGLYRKHFGFLQWKGHDKTLWDDLLKEAYTRKKEGLAQSLPEIRGYDASPKAISMAHNHIEAAGLENIIDVRVKELMNLVKPTHKQQEHGLIIANPPYGERLGDIQTLTFLYQHLGEKLKQEFIGWDAAILTSNPDLGKKMGIRAHKQYAFYNGPLPCKFLLFHLTTEWFVKKRFEDTPKSPEITPKINMTSGGEMFANRLKKKYKPLKKWAEKNKIESYRIYDADLPEYAIAIDKYKDWVHVQEYAPPKSIDPEKAAQRLNEAVSLLPEILSLPEQQIILKKRVKQKGKSQYEKQNSRGNYLEINENAARFLVNMTDYVDTGLFLDNRLLRQKIYSLSKNKKFLNLFCYTATSTVCAGLGGARNSTSVDMSKTYLDWARRNFALNGMSESLHKLIQVDCLKWLDENTEMFDLILLDPPTFSNSKKMESILDIQRDHVDLIKNTMRHLSHNGLLIFCTNFRKFKLSENELSEFNIKNITPQTIDKDFQHDPKIHHCFEVQWK